MDISTLTDAQLIAKGREARKLGLPDAVETLAAEAKRRKLKSCDGPCVDGVYHGAGRVENGKFIGFTGPCFRCGGKGYQTDADRRRNWGYDQHRRIPA